MGIRGLREKRYPVLQFVLLLLLSISFSCGASGSRNESPIDLEQFIKQARDAGCGNMKNVLYVIDNEFVLWDREGNCPDNAYSQTLYGRSVDQVLCTHFDTIAGPKTVYYYEKYREFFDTLLQNLDKPDLGLGPGHVVAPTSVLPACNANADCLSGEYCAKAIGECEGEGVCMAMPTTCPLAPVSADDIVCGCDGKTYGYYINACDAAAAGVNIAHKGACP
jgi:hypothetical protein